MDRSHYQPLVFFSHPWHSVHLILGIVNVAAGFFVPATLPDTTFHQHCARKPSDD